MLKVVDLFCGTGALSYGLSRADKDFVTVAGIDLDLSASMTAQRNHISAKILCADIESLSPCDFVLKTGIEDVDIVVGGPPCQGFSSLRPSRGLNLKDPRNNLYKSFVRYVEYMNPKVFLMENVVGLVGASGGRLLDEIVKSFESIGFAVEWRVLNAANFGVPQKRERLFVVGVNKGRIPRWNIVFPSPTHYFNGKVIGIRHKENYVVNSSKGYPALTLWEGISDLPSIKSGELSEKYNGSPRNAFQKKMRRGSRTLSLHAAANHSAKMLEVIRHSGASKNSLPEGLVESGYSSSYSRLSANEPATTITVKFTSPASSKCIHPFDNRAITPREAARIQSFDDSYIFCGSKTDIASQIGNAVPPIFGEVFSRCIKEMLK